MGKSIVNWGPVLALLAVPLLLSTPTSPTATDHASTRVVVPSTDSSDSIPAEVLVAAHAAARTGTVTGPVQWIQTTTSTYYAGSPDPLAARNIPIYVVQLTGGFILDTAPRPRPDAPAPHGSWNRTIIPLTPQQDFGGAGELTHDPKDLGSLAAVHTFTLK